MNTYISTHNHTEFSNLKLIDSINRANELIDYAYKLGLKGIAITDHDTISGHVQAWNYYNKRFSDEEKRDFKLILGNEIYLCRGDLTAETHQKGEKFYHLILLAKDDIGHEQIRRISAKAWGRAYMKNIMRTPTYSKDLMEIVGEDPGHLIATTACLGGYCGNMFQANNFDAIEAHLAAMSSLFGYDNFYIELQPSKQQDQIAYNNYMIAKYWDTYRFIFSTDSHYLNLDDQEVHKIFLNSKSSGDREVDSFYSSAYMMSYEEVKAYFIAQHIEEEKIERMAQNTLYIGDQIIGYNLKRTSVIPRISYVVQPLDAIYDIWLKEYAEETTWIKKVIEHNDKADIHLLNMVAQNWHKVEKDKERNYVIELDYEFEQLHKISLELKQTMSDYFITMAKMIDIMWEKADSIVGPARGSAASSLINYLLGITQIDPLAQPVEMPFWR